MSNIFEYFELIQNIEINFISFCKAFTIPIVKFVMGIIFILELRSVFLDTRKALTLCLASCDFCRLLITFANSLDPDQDQQNVGPDLDPNYLTQ